MTDNVLDGSLIGLPKPFLPSSTVCDQAVNCLLLNLICIYDMCDTCYTINMFFWSYQIWSNLCSNAVAILGIFTSFDSTALLCLVSNRGMKSKTNQVPSQRPAKVPNFGTKLWNYYNFGTLYVRYYLMFVWFPSSIRCPGFPGTADASFPAKLCWGCLVLSKKKRTTGCHHSTQWNQKTVPVSMWLVACMTTGMIWLRMWCWDDRSCT